MNDVSTDKAESGDDFDRLFAIKASERPLLFDQAVLAAKLKYEDPGRYEFFTRHPARQWDEAFARV